MHNQSQPTLIACPACGWQVSNQAVACPRCGQPIAANHIPPQSSQSTTDHRAEKRPLTEWEDILRLLGMVKSRFGTGVGTQLGMQPQKRLQPFTVTDKIKLGLLGVMVILVLIMFVVVPFALKDGNNKSGRLNNNGYSDNREQNRISTTASTAATPTVDLHAAAIEERVRRGERIYKRIEAKYRLPVEFTWQAEGINLLIPTKEWNSLTKEDQVSLSYYADKLISDIRTNPKKYVDKYWKFMRFQGNNAPAYNYESYIEAASNLCQICWKIELGKTIFENGKFDFEPEDTVVTGSNATAFRQSIERKR